MNKKYIVFILIALVFLSLFFYFLSRSTVIIITNDSLKEVTNRSKNEEIIYVQTERVERRDIKKIINKSGEVISNAQVIVKVDSFDKVVISVDDTAQVKVNNFSESEILGVVTNIKKNSGTKGQIINFEVMLKLINPPEALRQVLPCNVEIVTESVTNVLSIPIQCVTGRNNNMKQGSPREIVFIVENGKAKQVNVETGINDDNYIEIKRGLNDGEEIISGSYGAISRQLNDGSLVEVVNK